MLTPWAIGTTHKSSSKETIWEKQHFRKTDVAEVKNWKEAESSRCVIRRGWIWVCQMVESEGRAVRAKADRNINSTITEYLEWCKGLRLKNWIKHNPGWLFTNKMNMKLKDISQDDIQVIRRGVISDLRSEGWDTNSRCVNWWRDNSHFPPIPS